MMNLSLELAFSFNLVQDVQDMLSLDFMRYAFLSGTLLSIVSGLVGYFVVLRYQVFAVEALSHVTFTGALGVAIAGGNPLLGLFGVTLLAAIGMGGLEMRSQARARDVAIGTLLAWVLGLGALFLSLYTTSANGAIGVNLLFGSIFGIQAQQATLTAVFSLITIAALLAIARPLLFASVDPEVAVARGVPVRGLNFAFLALVALSVAIAVPAVGALLNSALIVTPAAIAQRLVARPFVALWLSALLAVSFTWAGLALGFYAPYPIGFVISAIAFGSYAGVVVWQRLTK
jgi:zinc/manganese transport system permease protein